MGKLIKKEFLLSLNPNVILMGVLSLTIMIPSYPSFVAFFYLLGGLASIMPRSLADKDIEYTSMLPIPKANVVKAKIWLFILLELGTIVFTVPFALLRNFLIDPMAASSDPNAFAEMVAFEPSLSTYGFAFIVFGIYNILFFPWYYKNPQKINAPQTVATILTMLISLLFLALPLIPSLGNYLSASSLSDSVSLYVQIGILVGGLLIGGFLTWLSSFLASKHFEKVDI